MNSSNHSDQPHPAYVRQTELLWTPQPHSQSQLKNCCFCLSDWLIYLAATLSIVLGGIIFIAFALSKPAVHYLHRRFSLHLPARGLALKD